MALKLLLMPLLFFKRIKSFTPLLLFLLFFVPKTNFGQGADTIVKGWIYTQSSIARIDSMANKLVKHKVRFASKKSVLKYRDKSGSNYLKRIKIKRSPTRTVQTEAYKIKGSCKIKVLKVNGEPEIIKSKFISREEELKVKNKFTHVGNNNWIWTQLYKKRYFEAGKRKVKKFRSYEIHVK